MAKKKDEESEIMSSSSSEEEAKKKKKKHKKRETSSSEEESSEEEKKPKRGKNKDSSEESSSSSEEYATSDEEDAVEIINNFLPQEVNIVLLGGTGVGKSTFINSIANMLSHSTLEDAMMDLHVLTRTSFHHIKENHELKHIVMEPTIQVERQGEAGNEGDKVGESCTKYPRSYVFKYGRKNERTLRIIDTPGVGDARGVEQDRENLRLIINFVSSFREIHAFLFLMKPNDSRLELQFRYCINELLTHLHVSATNNIIFTFTNGRGTNYKPSETFGILQALLNSVKEESGVEIQLKDRCLVFDNESYRYLCECQYAIQHKDWEVKNNEKSWKHGKKELSRMLEMIAGFDPHDVNNTLSVNKVRRAIEIMARPLAELVKNLLINIRLIEEKEIEIEECLRIKRNLEDCLSIIFRGHMNYSPFFDGELADRAIQEVLASTNNKKKMAEDFLATKRTERDALERNLQRKQTICAHFAIFLKDNSVLAYNDQYLAYLNAFIREEREKVNRGANGETLARLESCHDQYKELKKIFDNPATGKKMTLIEIENLIEGIMTMNDEDLIRDVHGLEIFYPAHEALDAPAITIKQKTF